MSALLGTSERGVSGQRDDEPSGVRSMRNRVALPTYDRRRIDLSVVHIGVGGFARAHQLRYFDDVAERRISTAWGVVGVGLRNRALKEALEPQNYLYLLVERSAQHDRARVVGSLLDYLFAPDDPRAVLTRLADPRTKLVTMTVTADAYQIDPRLGCFDPADSDVRADLSDPHHPRSLLGYLVEALDIRRRNGVAPFTVLSCDNMQDNGLAAQTAVTGFAGARDEVLGRWVADAVAFPGSMVDRITPRMTPALRASVSAEYGVDDRWPVVTESFSRWVVEDRFCNARPPLDQVGVTMVPDVAPYVTVKTRLLNGGHSALGHLGQLAGFSTMPQMLADPVFRKFAIQLMDEVSPLLPRMEDFGIAEYKRDLLDRLANPAIGDRLERLCARGSSKIPNFVLPSLREATDESLPNSALVLAVAGFLRYLRGTDDAGHRLGIRDENARELSELALIGGADPRPALSRRDVFGDLEDRREVVESLTEVLTLMDRHGVRAAVGISLARSTPFAGSVRGVTA